LLDIVVDYALLAAPEVSADGFIGALLNGTFYDPDVATNSPYTPAQIPDRDANGKDF
jgi:hypothetical protein